MSDEETLSIDAIKPKMEMTGVVRKTDLAGAVVEVEGFPAFLHISQIRKNGKRVDNVEDAISEGEEITVWVLEVDRDSNRLLVSMEKPPAVTWEEISEGKVFTGTVRRLKKYGAFIDIGAERPGLVHVSEMSSDYVEHPRDVVKKGDEVEVMVIGLDRQKNQIDLSMKALSGEAAPEPTYISDAPDDSDLPTAMAVAMQRALEQASGDADQESGNRSQGKKQREQLDDLLRRTLERHNDSSS